MLGSHPEYLGLDLAEHRHESWHGVQFHALLGEGIRLLRILRAGYSPSHDEVGVHNRI